MLRLALGHLRVEVPVEINLYVFSVCLREGQVILIKKVGILLVQYLYFII